MHARVATARVRPGSADEVAAGWRRLLDPYERTGVFHGMVSLHDPEADRAVTLTLWRSSADADAVAEQLRSQAFEVFADVLMEAPEITGYDVLLNTFADPSGGAS